MAKSTRRRFLADTLLAASAAAAGPIVSSQVFAEEKKNSSPNDKLSVMVAGLNGRGRSHLAGFAGRNGCEVTYICDVDESLGEKTAKMVAERQGGRKPKFIRDMREALDDPSLDIATFATPNHWHALGGIWAVQAGKDVYVEKPISHNVAEGRSLAEAARKYNKMVQVGTQCRSTQGMINAVNYVKSGKIGEVKFARGLCYKRRKSIGPKGLFEPPKSLDYTLWQGPATDAPITRQRFHYDWHWQNHWGNGDMGNQGPHQMDICRWGLGWDSLSEKVISYGGRLGYEDAGDVANTQVAIHQLGDETITFEVRGLETDAYRMKGWPELTDENKDGPYCGAKVGLVFYGSEGYVVMHSYAAGSAFDLDGKVITTFGGGGNHFDNLIEAVKKRDRKILTAEALIGHLSAGLAHTGTISYNLGEKASAADIKKVLDTVKCNDDTAETLDRTISHLKQSGVDLDKTPLTLGPMLSMDPKTETFKDNAAANKLLTREYRKGFEVPKPDKV
jgi:Oxidoreductase family, NAD-binding Rossmann fold